MLDIVLPILGLSGLLYALHQAPRLAASKRSSRRLSQPGEAGWKFEYADKTLSVWTSGLNSVPQAIVSSSPSALKRLYDVGSATGIVGAVVAIGGGLWALEQVWAAVWAEARLHAMQKVDTAAVQHGIAKRAFEYLASTSPSERAPSGGLQPLIPGVTIPLSHALTLALVLVLNQLVHELGHALAAACDDITPLRLSFNLHIVVPSMMVTLPKTVDHLGPISQMRLSSSGPWHNLLTYVLLGTIPWTGVSQIFWRDITDLGRVVDSVNPQSPLSQYLGMGTIVTHLDDLFVGGTEDRWTTYLQGEETGDAGRGWCILKSAYEALPLPPCTGTQEIVFRQTDEPSPSTDRCLAPHPMLDVPSSPCPCAGTKWICVRPSSEERVLRIRLDDRHSFRGKTVLWAGDRHSVLDDVKVGSRVPRLAAGIVRWWTMFFDYLSSIALSLFFFNLLPLPHADGSHMLRALLGLVKPRHRSSTASGQKPLQATLSSPLRGASTSRLASPSIDLYKEYELSDDEDGYGDEEGGRRGVKEERWKTRLRKTVEASMVALVLGWAGGWAMLALLRSS